MLHPADEKLQTQRADAVRNRELLLTAASKTFAAAEAFPSMRAIAREARVGIATLYRHFPSREALVEAVYEHQVQRLTRGADELLQQFPPEEALRRWMNLFGEWMATKHGMTETLLAMIDGGELSQAQTRTELLAAIGRLLEAGRALGTLRADVSATDIATGLLGILAVAGRPEQREQAQRLMDLLMDAMKHPGQKEDHSGGSER